LRRADQRLEGDRTRRLALITTLDLEDAAATERLARAMAPHLRAGDVVGLTGPLGAGKSLFARAAILERLAALGRAEEVPSPSYTLVQEYDLGGVALWHADLYRLGSADELVELGLDEAFATAVCLVEWPERLGAILPERRLMLALDFVSGADDARRARLEAIGAWDWLPGVLAAEAAA
jgi:tRNA threonylcarbamoyladenosine biosynthesis protein TsaE